MTEEKRKQAHAPLILRSEDGAVHITFNCRVSFVTQFRGNQVPGEASSRRKPANESGEKMRYSLPIALALAAVTVASVSGTATAFNNNSNPWTAPLFKDQPIKPPKANTNQNPSATQSTTTPTKPSKANTNQNPSETQTTLNAPATTSNSSGTRRGSNPKPAADLKKDIAKQTEDIKKYEGNIAELQQMKSNVANLKNGPRSGSKFGPTVCDSSGCTSTFTFSVGSYAGVTIKVRVDTNGLLLPGESDKVLNAQTKALDLAIDANIRWIADAKQQIQADYAANPQMLGGGTVQAPRGSTALHQN